MRAMHTQRGPARLNSYFSKRSYLTGFTLIELLIGSVIFVIIMAALYAAFHTGIISSRRMDSASAIYQTARIVLSRLEADLKNSYAVLSADTRLRGDAYTLDFFSMADTFDRGRRLIVSEPSHIRYEFRDGLLLRKSVTGAGVYTALIDTMSGQELSSDISDLTLRFAIPVNRSFGTYEWLPAWPQDDEQKKNFPLAVQIELTVREPGTLKNSTKAKTVLFTKVVALPLSNL
jgi:prepilin-type N-terminal cleavage/methylation domain-containing protein